MARFAVVIALAGCGGGLTTVLTTDEEPAGFCAKTKLAPGESCRPGAREYAGGISVGVPRGHMSDRGGTAWFRWPIVDVELDARTLRRGVTDHRSIAGGVGAHLRPLIFWPNVNRYIDIVVGGGFDLGLIDMDSHIDGRGDGYLTTSLDLYAPDFGPFRFLGNGIPGLRAGVRYTEFVLGWPSETTFELGLVWRLGVPIDLYRHWTTHRSGD